MLVSSGTAGWSLPPHKAWFETSHVTNSSQQISSAEFLLQTDFTDKKTHIVEGLPVSVLTPPAGADSLHSFEPAIDRKERMEFLISN